MRHNARILSANTQQKLCEQKEDEALKVKQKHIKETSGEKYVV